jgi:predicted ribosome quality control (RQC) complex YloA/Tae2 family protein
MRVTEDELLLAAHYQFTSRLADVVAATLTYQRDRRTHDRCVADAAETERVLATAHRLTERLPASLGLLALAENQHARALREAERAGDRLRASGEAFYDTVGGAVADVMAAMEAHHYALDRPKLMATLRRNAAVSDRSGA